MIGLIGPRDSIALASRVAADLGVADRVIARAYESADEASALAAELDSICGVLLFTGRVPYALARHDRPLRATLDFVPHGGIDLYRALAIVLRDHGGSLPRLSLDTIERPVVEEAYADLGLTTPPQLLSLDTDASEDQVRRPEDIAAFHAGLVEGGEVDLCLTCLGSVRDDLARRGIPVLRVEHTREALRDALRRAVLADQLAQSRATQIAVALIEPEPAGRGRRATRYERERSGLHAREQALDLAERLQGTLVDGPDGALLIHSTRGAVERELARSGNRIVRGLAPGTGRVAVGFGIGTSVASAEEHARAALQLGRSAGGAHLVLDDGSIRRLGGERAGAGYRLRETDQRILARSRELGLGPLTIARLSDALRRVDPAAVTARDLARAYGVTPRSALRLLATLQEAGLATVLGARVTPRAGRPETVFRVNVEGLFPPT